MADNAELGRVSKSANDLRDVVDALHEALGAERGYLLIGSKEERDSYENWVQTVRKSLAQLHATDGSEAWLRFDALVNERLAGLARGAALQAAGRHDEAVLASDVGTRRALAAAINAIAHERISAFRERYFDIMDQTGTASDRGNEFARVMFGLAGALFALGCIVLIAYLRRHFIAEAELRAGRDAALESAGIKTRFIATASHDLRQPLHAISMFVGVLRRRSNDPAVLEVVERIGTAVATMQRMFAVLLDVARLDAGAVKAERRGFALQEMFDTLAVEFAASAAAKGLVLQLQPTSLSVLTDPALLETILRNLLSNAVKFTDRGVVGLTARCRDAMVDIIVFDTGIGIAEKDQTTVFGQFERLGQSGGSREGLGLGLSIVQRMADLLSVTVTLESKVASGSRFTVSLPLAETAQTPVQQLAVPGPELLGDRILVLDDHPDARKAIALAIETLGALPLEAASPQSAFRLLAAMAPERPQAAVVDHDLGDGQTGPEFLDAYAAESGQIMPAVIVTGSTEALTLATLTATGRPWLIKPVELDVLRLTLAKLVQPTSVRQRATAPDIKLS
jgi:signal transduction histidine kinase